MATVPTLDNNRVDQQRAPGLQVRNQVDARQLSIPVQQDAELAQSLGQAGQTISRIGEKLRERKIATNVFAGTSALQQRIDEQQQAIQRDRLGGNAAGVTDEALEGFDKYSNELMAAVDDPESRLLLNQKAQALRRSFGNSVSQFEDRETRNYLDVTATAAQTGAVNAAISAGTPEAIESARKQIDQTVRFMAQHKGLGNPNDPVDPVITAARTKELTKLHSGIIAKLVDETPEQAEAYLEANRSEIAGDQIDNLNKLVRAGTLTTKTQALTADLQAQGLTEQEGVDYIKENFEGKDEEAYSLQWRRTLSEQRTAVKRLQEDANDQARTIYGDTGQLPPPSLLNVMSPAAKLSLERMSLADARRNENGGVSKVKTPLRLYADLEKQIANDPEAFATRDLNLIAPDLSESDQRRYVKLQEKMKSPAGVKDAVTLQQDKAAARAQLGIGGSKDDLPKRAAVDTAIQDAIDREQGDGPPLKHLQRKKIIDELLVSGRLEFDYGRDPKIRTYKLQDAEQVGRFYIPLDEADGIGDEQLRGLAGQNKLGTTGDRAKAKAALLKLGRPADDKAVGRYLYDQIKGRK